MQYRYLYLLFILFSNVASGQQNIPVAKVTDKFDRIFLSENFDSSGSYWTTISNAENLILVQDGEYILNRKATSAPFASMAAFNNSLNAFRLITSLKLERTLNDEGTIGVIFMAQPGGQGGFIFEINRNQQYRLRQISGNAWRYITGNSGNSGWIRSSVVKAPSLPNLVDIRTNNKMYDIYLNNTLLLSFEELAYKSGDMGYIIGPGSKGTADFFYLFTNEKASETSDSVFISNSSQAPDLVELAESIISLKTELNRVKEENDELKKEAVLYRASLSQTEDKELQYREQISALKKEIANAGKSFDSLMKVNGDLQKYREMVKGNDNGDLVINLSKSLKSEKLKNEELNEVIRQLRDSIQTLKQPGISNNQPQKDKKPSDGNEQPKEFVLPKEN